GWPRKSSTECSSKAARIARHVAASIEPVMSTSSMRAANVEVGGVTVSGAGPAAMRSGLLEVDPLVDRQPLQVAAQAVESHLDGTQAHPFAPAQDAGLARYRVPLGGDREADRASELDAVGAVVQIDQHREGVARAGMGAGGTGHRLRDLRGGRGVGRGGGGGRRRPHPPAGRRGGGPWGPPAAHTSGRARATAPRRNTASAPGRWASRAAIWPLVNDSTSDSVADFACSSRRITPSRVWASSARMDLSTRPG